MPPIVPHRIIKHPNNLHLIPVKIKPTN